MPHNMCRCVLSLLLKWPATQHATLVEHCGGVTPLVVFTRLVTNQENAYHFVRRGKSCRPHAPMPPVRAPSNTVVNNNTQAVVGVEPVVYRYWMLW